MKYLFVDHCPEPGGAQLALLRLAGALQERGHDIHILLLSDGEMHARYLEAGIPVSTSRLDEFAAATRHGSQLRLYKTLLLNMVRANREVRSMALTFGADVVHANTPKAWSACLFLRADRRTGSALSFHVRDILASPPFPRPALVVLRALVSLVPNMVVSNSNATSESIGWTRGRRAVIESPAAIRTDAAPPPPMPFVSPLRAVSVSRLDWWKGQDNVIRLIARLREMDIDIRLRVLGDSRMTDGSFEIALKELVAELALEEHVEFAGWVEDVRSELDGSDLFLHLPSEPEPLGQVVIEAMSRGLLVGVDGRGGPGELVHDGTNGLILQSNHLSDSAARLSNAIGDAALVRDCRQAAVEHMVGLQPHRIAERFEAFTKRFGPSC